MPAETTSLRTDPPHAVSYRRAGPWWVGWGPIALLPALVLLLAPADWPRWALMWLLSVVIFGGVKWLTWRRTPVRNVPLGQHVGYLFGWPGLDAVSFLKPIGTTDVPRPERSEWLFALGKLALGLAVLFGLTRLIPADYPYVVGWVGMTGIALVLHFGTFHLLSCAWRNAGVDAKPLMNWPLSSVSLSEYWSRRWNTAFRDLAHRFLFKPLTPPLGAHGALFAGFLFSGLVHDAVISIPAEGGYGGPTLFFLIQAAGLLIERSAWGRALGLGKGWRGWLFTMTMLLAPALLLFHPPFVTRVVVPFLQAVGAA